MFGKKRRTRSFPDSPEIGLLGAGTRFAGTIRFRGTLRLDGEVVGDIHSVQGSGSILVINREAKVRGTIVSDAVMISGRVHGDIIAQERVEIFRNGAVKGDIYTNEIMIEGGAEFQGRCRMIRKLSETQKQALAKKFSGAFAPVMATETERLDEKFTA